MLKSGAITDASYFGPRPSWRSLGRLGLDVALGRHYALHVGGFFNQEGLSFKAGTLHSATDQTIGGSAAFVLLY